MLTILYIYDEHICVFDIFFDVVDAPSAVVLAQPDVADGHEDTLSVVFWSGYALDVHVTFVRCVLGTRVEFHRQPRRDSLHSHFVYLSRTNTT